MPGLSRSPLDAYIIKQSFMVSEIFKSIQGESTWAGSPCTFVRLTGCNLRCSYCDTTYAYSDGREMSGKQIIKELNSMGPKLVALTGGEPLFQKHASSLVTLLLDRGYKVLIETNGTFPTGELDSRAVIILDVKTPGSGMEEAFDLNNLRALKKTDEVKFVLVDRHDYMWAKEWIVRYRLEDLCTVLLSPAFGFLKPELLASWILQDNLSVRLNLQIHKYIWGPHARGV